MKVIVVEHNWEEPADDTIKAHLMADSAIMTSDKPFFLPDVLPQLDARLTMAVRVGRLGKYVASRFAHRYCQDFTAAIVAVPRQRMEQQPMAAALDGALMLGNWIASEQAQQNPNACLQMLRNGQVACSGCIATLNHPIDEVIEHVSKFCTLKTGDIVLTGLHPLAVPLAIGDKLHATFDGIPVLDIRVK